MAQLPTFKRLLKEDFPAEYQTLVDKLAFPLNSALESISNALDKNLTFDENISTQTKSLTIKVDSSGIPITEASFQISLKTKINGILCAREENLTNSTIYPSSGIFINFVENSKIVTIKHITGLSANDNHRLLLLIF